MEREIKLSLGDQEEDIQVPEPEFDLEDQVDQNPAPELSPEEMRQVEEFASKIDLKNTNLVLQYGASAQKNIASFSEKTLESVRTKDLGEVGDLLSNVVTELKNFDIDEDENAISKFFKRSANRANSLKTRYDKVQTNVDKISSTLEGHQVQLMKDIATLDHMYDLNESYYKELSMYILAGRKKLEEARNVELPQLLAQADRTNHPADAQKANDYQSAISRFDKKLHDLDLTRMVSLQMAPQIRMVQASNTVMVEKIQTTIINTIPLWKSQMVISLGAAHSLEAAKAQNEVTQLTNDILNKNADALRMATVEATKASERSVVDLDTIKHTNDQLIAALSEVRQIQLDGERKRQEATRELQSLEQDLKDNLKEIAKEYKNS